MGMAMKAAPCLATGNTLIMKSSEKTPLSTIYLGKLVNEAGFPPGVFNIISGGALTGSLLAKHMGINQISFTGSAGVGKQIAQAASQSNLKRIALELGGKSPSIIFPDAKLDMAIPWCVDGILVLSGQVCFASSRVYAHESIKKQVVEQMQASFETKLELFGDTLDRKVEFPPLVDKFHFDKVKGFIDRGKKEATLITGGNAISTKV
jgi:acyl-CoA reductase-like NAD-dependent aldehyde dehydrogenase